MLHLLHHQYKELTVLTTSSVGSEL